MSAARKLYDLVQKEYAVSKHIFWLDEATGDLVNDVSYTLRLIIAAARGMRVGDEEGWVRLVRYAVDRAMSGELKEAIGKYLGLFDRLPGLPLVIITQEGAWYDLLKLKIVTVQLFEDTVFPRMTQAHTFKPEQDRIVALKHEHEWTNQEWRLSDKPPDLAPSVRHHWF